MRGDVRADMANVGVDINLSVVRHAAMASSVIFSDIYRSTAKGFLPHRASDT